MEVEPSVVKKELLDLKRVAKKASSPKEVATKLNDIGFDHIPTTQYRSGTQIKTELLTKVSDLVATAKQGENADGYIKEAQSILTVALKIDPNQVYSTELVNGNYKMPSFSLKKLASSIDQDLKAFN